MNNAQRAILFAGVVFFVLIVTMFSGVNDARGRATQAVEMQTEQIIKAKECAANCDALIESGEMECEWIECHERCQIGQKCQARE